jgi:hypothetical protein
VKKRSLMTVAGTSVMAISALAFVGVGPALAHPDGSWDSPRHHKTVTLRADLDELNDSGASGRATVVVKNQRIKHVDVRARGLTPDAPHAQHIHYGDQARNECPTAFDDTNDDGRLTTLEGVPAYGPVVVSLTTTGDTSPASLLAVDRFPVAEHGRYHYSRNNIKFTKVEGTGDDGDTGTAREIAKAVRHGEGVVVIHGTDYDRNGAYSLSKEGASELDPSLPAEATDPVACGLLH